MTNQQVEQEIWQLETRRFEAVVRGDVAALEGILSDDLTYTHATGVFETKAEFLGKMKSGQLKYESFGPEDFRVRVYGTGVIGSSRVPGSARPLRDDLLEPRRDNRGGRPSSRSTQPRTPLGLPPQGRIGV